ncbi:MAG: potassium-transporting ATPase subunit KdpA [Rickettsiales bacterium]
MHDSVWYMLLLLALLVISIKPLGWYMARVYMRREVWLERPLGWVERLTYKLCGINPHQEMNWKTYTLSMVFFSLLSAVTLFFIFTYQNMLPLNPQGFEGMSTDLAFNTAISFVSNTNWQSYSGEATLSIFSQIIGCMVQNFLSAATGMAVAVALFRALAARESNMLGNFWVDVVRGVLYILLPLALLFSLVLVSQGVVQSLDDYTTYQPIEATEGVAYEMARGPVATQAAIKMLGSSGGGFFNTNAAHPFANPTAFSNFLQTLSILLLPAGLVYCFGVMVGDRRQGWGLLAAMFLIFIPLASFAISSELTENPLLPETVDQAAGNMEGKEVRIGAPNSALWAVATTATSNGSVNAMHDSFMPLGSLIPLVLVQFGEVVFGGVGTGMHGMLIYVIIAVFIGGLMVGRTPEYLGKKLGVREMQITTLCVLIPQACLLFGTAIAINTEAGVAGIFNPGAQGFTEVLYAFASASNNNGSALAGLNANTPFYNIALGTCIAIYRFALLVLVLALAGSLSAKRKMRSTAGMLPTHTPLFILMLVVTILLVDVLTYIPVMALGPVAEHIHLFHIGVTP